jgi:hypothetical protein
MSDVDYRRRAVAKAIAEAALVRRAETQPHSIFRESARRLAQRVVVYLEQQGYTPEELYDMPGGLDMIQPTVIAVSTRPLARHSPLPTQLYSTAKETDLCYRVQTTPWKWTTLRIIGLVREAVLTIRDGRSIVTGWGTKEDRLDHAEEV